MQQLHAVAVVADGDVAVAAVAAGYGAGGDVLPSGVAVAATPVAGSAVAEFASSVAVAVASFVAVAVA